MNNPTFPLSKLIFPLFFIFLGVVTHPVFAQTGSTGSATIDPESVKDSIKDRIQKVVSQSDTLGISTNLGYYGQVQSLTQDTISINVNQLPQLIGISPNTVFRQNGSTIDLADIEIGSNLIAIGTIDSDDVLTANTIILPETPAEPVSKTTYFGIVEDVIPRQRQILTASSSAQPGLKLVSSTATRYTTQASLSAPSSDTFDYTDLNPGDQIIVIYQPNSRNASNLDLLLLHLVSSSTPIETDAPTP